MNHRKSKTPIVVASRRKGSFVALSVGVIAMLTIIAGYCINLSYIELARTEQRLATDAAAKAASVRLGQSQSVEQAREVAIQIAGMHTIAGQPLLLTDDSFEFGVCLRDNAGRFNFTPGENEGQLNAVLVNSNLLDRPNGGAKIAFLPSVLKPTYFNLNLQAIATKVDMDLCIVVDRSGSMSWDLSNNTFQYPGDMATKSSIQNYFQLPHPELSRWAALEDAMSVFLEVLNGNPFETRVSLASYASNFTFGVFESQVATLDHPLTDNYQLIEDAFFEIGTQPLIGNTNIAAGLREGIEALTDPDLSRITASKTIVLLTDGVMTQGDDPVALAQLARERNIRIHTVAFSAQADVDLMQRVAAAGGGNFYNAPNAETLTAVFLQIAETLPAMLAR
jgi:hypothetical protein